MKKTLINKQLHLHSDLLKLKILKQGFDPFVLRADYSNTVNNL